MELGGTGSNGVLDASATEVLLPSTFIEGVGCKMLSTCNSSMARGGLVGDAFVDECQEGGNRAHGEVECHKQPSNKRTLHAYAKGVIRALGTLCGRFPRAFLSAFRKALRGGHCYKHEGQKEKGGPKRGQSCYVIPTFSGVPSAKRGEKNQRTIVSPPRAGGRI